MSKLFLDMGYLIALESSDDQHHDEAISHWRKLSQSLPELATTSYVFDEVVTFFNSRGRHAKSVEIGQMLLESPSVDLVYVDRPLFREAWRYFREHSDKAYSFTDCVSFVAMGRLKIVTALTFDHHFVQAGFERLPV